MTAGCRSLSCACAITVWANSGAICLRELPSGWWRLPLAMAFAIASGLTPQAGIYCAIVTGFLISALGGSKTQIGGPTGAFVVVVAGIVAVHGVEGLFICTMMAGVLLVIMGLTGLGSAMKFIPRPIVIGFTNGIAVLIASTQIKDFFGLHIGESSRRIFDALAGAGGELPHAFLHRDGSGAGHGRNHYFCAAAISRSHSRVDCRFAGGHGGCGDFQIAGGNDRHALWRDSQRACRIWRFRNSGRT